MTRRNHHALLLCLSCLAAAGCRGGRDRAPEAAPPGTTEVTSPRSDQPIAKLGPGRLVLWSNLEELTSTASRGEIDIMGALAEEAGAGGRVTIDYPLEQAVFPDDMAPPTFRWHDSAKDADAWMVEIAVPGGRWARLLVPGGPPEELPEAPMPMVDGKPYVPTKFPEDTRPWEPSEYERTAKTWRPSRVLWRAMRRAGRELTVRITGLARKAPGRALSSGVVHVTISEDPVDAPIFFRDVPLPFFHALKNLRLIRWRLGEVSEEEPRTMLDNLSACGNCHSFPKDGHTLAMDVDYANDKGSYVITEIGREKTVLDKSKVITWMDYKRDDGQPTFGLLSQISPDGRFVVSTVKDSSVFVPIPDMMYSQLFFPVKGILVYYDRQKRTFASLPGADDPKYVQSNPSWSPDGKYIYFAKAEAYSLKYVDDEHRSAVIKRAEAREFVEDGRKFRYDIYKVPFDGGRGGVAEPVPGASDNGRSNFFPKVSPDGRWLVFCQADSYMLLQQDSELYIMPAEGGTPRRMRANFAGKMNSWHSWSPNGRWLVFSSKATGPYTRLWLTHVDEQGRDSVPVLLERFATKDRAANIPEFVNIRAEEFGPVMEAFEDHYTYLRYADEYIRHDEWERAAKELEKALHLKPDYAEAHKKMGLVARALGRLDESLAHLDRAIELAPDDAWNYGDKARTLLALGRGGPEVDRLLQQAMAHLPQRSKDLDHMGRLFMDVERYDLAKQVLAEAAHKDPEDPAILEDYGTTLCMLGEIEACVRRLEAVVALDPKNDQAHHNLGLAFERQGRLADAAREYRAAIQANPGAGVSHYRLAKILGATGELQGAARHMADAYLLDMDTPELRAEALATMAAAGLEREAATFLREALTRRPEDPGILVDLAWLLATSPDGSVRAPQTAVKLARRANAATAQSSIRALDTLAAAYAAAGRFEDAQATANHAVELAQVRDTALLPGIRARMAGYAKGRAFVRAAAEQQPDTGGPGEPVVGHPKPPPKGWSSGVGTWDR